MDEDEIPSDPLISRWSGLYRCFAHRSTGRALLCVNRRMSDVPSGRILIEGPSRLLMFALAGATVPPAEDAKTIKVIVPVAPGGALDYVARLLARGGSADAWPDDRDRKPVWAGGTAIGTEAVARATADGDTLLAHRGREPPDQPARSKGEL